MTKAFKVFDLPLTDVIVRDRAREELGKVDDLIHSIQYQGLLNPIIVNESLQLIAGERRFRSFEILRAAALEEDADSTEWSTIPARIMPLSTTGDEKLIELVENTARKAFVWQEEVDLRVAIHNYYCDTNDSWTILETADKLGVSKATIATDLKIFEFIKYFPDIRNFKTREKALNACKQLERQSEATKAIRSMTNEDKKVLNKLLCGTPTPTSTTKTSKLVKSPEKPTPNFCYEIEDCLTFVSKLPDNSVGFVEMDPPYAMNFEKNYGQREDMNVDFVDWSVDEFHSTMSSLITGIVPKLLTDTWVLCWTAFEHVDWLMSTFSTAGFHVQRPCIWVKPGGTGNSLKTNAISNYEIFLLARWGNPVFNTPHFKGAFIAKSLQSTEKIHPTEKPIDGVYDVLFTALKRPGAIFYSPFAGSGNSMIAAMMNGMVPLGSDLRDDYRPTFIARVKAAVDAGRIEVANVK